jgi:hypothetical protein
MKNLSIYLLLVLGLGAYSCAERNADVTIQDTDFPFRLVYGNEEGADLPDASDYSIEIEFADDNRDLPSSEITLTYTLTGSGDFANASIDEIIYEYEDDDCVFIREVTFDDNSFTIPVDADLGTVPEAIEIVISFNLTEDEAQEGGFTLEIIEVSPSNQVAFNASNTFEYGILENDLAGAWAYEIQDGEDLSDWQEVFGVLSADFAQLSFTDLTGNVALEFEFEEMKIEFELQETELIEECEDGETTSEEESIVVEIEAEWDAEDGEFELEGSYFNEDGEELDFILEGTYAFDIEDNLLLTVTSIIDEDGEELFDGEITFTLIRD